MINTTTVRLCRVQADAVGPSGRKGYQAEVDADGEQESR